MEETQAHTYPLHIYVSFLTHFYGSVLHTRMSLHMHILTQIYVCTCVSLLFPKNLIHSFPVNTNAICELSIRLLYHVSITLFILKTTTLNSPHTFIILLHRLFPFLSHLTL